MEHRSWTHPSAAADAPLVARARRAADLSTRERQASLSSSTTSTLTLRDRRDRRPARPLGLGQVDAAAHHRRADPAERRRRITFDGQPRRRPCRRHRHGVPELRAVSLADRAARTSSSASRRKASRPPSGASARSPRSTSSASTASKAPIRRSCPAACASASGLARALVVHPKILLMDEPFSALDVLTAETLRTDLLDLWCEGRMPIEVDPDGHAQHRGGGADVRPHPRSSHPTPAASSPRSRSTCRSRATVSIRPSARWSRTSTRA